MLSPIQIVLDANKRLPRAFRWKGKTYSISNIQECWRLVGAWWDGEGERTFFRIQAENGGIFEICYDHYRRTWLLEKVED